MILVFYFASVLLFCLPIRCFSTSNTTSTPICPKSFHCQAWHLRPFEYPFYNVDQRCGLIKVNCTANGAEIQVGNRSYEIGRPLELRSSFFVHDGTFQELIAAKRCEALTNNFTSPSPLLYSISIQPFIILYKCTKHPDHAAEMDAYFRPANYYSYNRCIDHSFYYKYSISDKSVPRNLPARCEVIQLPMVVKWPDDRKGPNYINVFSLLSARFFILFKMTPSCDKCHKDKGQCQINNGKFQCLGARTASAEKAYEKPVVITVLAGSAFILMLSSIFFMIWRRYKSNPFSYYSSKDVSQDLEDGSLFFGVPVFSYNDLEDATRKFDPSQELGYGGFGAVYYGKLRDGREVAVKRLYGHNYKQLQHFMNEVEILTKLRHRNLVLLYGCTSCQSRELLLVYEYISNGTVADHLHGEQANPSLLTWPIRMNIAIETASALVYLHASEIIHRDVKTNNLLLDHNFCVKVADFGLSRLLPNDVTHVSTAPQGTPGYLDPQYHQCYQLTDKSDVYSFGVVLMELISSMAAIDVSRSRDEVSLANLAINRIQRCAFDQLIDPVLGSESNTEIKRMITSVAELAFRCLQFDSDLRPTMNEVLDVLEDIQAEGKITAHDSIEELENVKTPPSPETKDSTVLLENLPASISPVSVTGKWHSNSNSSRSTTPTISGDRLPVKNRIDT